MQPGKLLTLVYSYYDNPNMYRRQVQEWERYLPRVKYYVSIIVTDDCSTKFPLRDIPEVPNNTKIRRFQITRKVPWNWLACRNIGTHHAPGRWILLTDMDHLVSVENIERIAQRLRRGCLKEDWVYLFVRKDAPNNTKYKPHNDSYMMTRKLYWKIGGYDEELAGNYGTSGRFRVRAYAISADQERLNIPLIRYPREVIADASTTEFSRKGEGRDPDALRRIEWKKRKEKRTDEILTMSFPYQEIK